VIIGISRGGLYVAALLSEAFGLDKKKPIIPVISLWPHPKFDNSFNKININKAFSSKKNSAVKIIIADDICRSGKTLDDAKTYVEKSIDVSNCEIKTAAISFYERQYSQPIAPTFFVDRPRKEITDSLGHKEPFGS
jgi:hypoxanthine phosphoribosyltransferase